VALALTAMLIVNHNFARAGNHDQFALAVGHITHRCVEANHAVGLGFDAGRNRRTRCSTTDVEGPHRQLCAGLTDRLGGDDTNCFADVDQATTAQIAAVTTGAQAEAGFAGQCGTHFDFVHASNFQLVNQVLIQHDAGLGQYRAVLGVQDVFDGSATQNAVAQRFNDFTTLDDGAHHRAVERAAVVFGHDQILHHIAQAASQVTGIGRFQRRVGQALAGAVGGDEVLQHVQTLAEVGHDGGFDDGAVRLGHQTAHAGHLANLGCRTTGAGVGHHVDRIERFLLDFLAMSIEDLFFRKLGHHDLGDFVA